MLEAQTLFRAPSDFRRPWMHHLNADTSWLLQIPAADHDDHVFFNVLIDPWFIGSQIAVSAWIHEQSHTVAAAVQSISEVEDFLYDVERIAGKMRIKDKEGSSEKHPSMIDAVTISLDVSDHAHKDTLLQVHPDVPLFGLKLAADLIRTWNHFSHVSIIPFQMPGSNWQTETVPLAPGLANISGLMQKGDKSNLHNGLLITMSPRRHCDDVGVSKRFNDNPRTQSGLANPQAAAVEAIAYIPHGITSTDLQFLSSGEPPLRFLALLQGLHLVNVGLPFAGWNFDSNNGAHDGLKTQRLLKAKYWLATHDELKEEKGLTSYFLRRQPFTFEDALQQSMGMDESENAPVETDWVNLGSGDSMILLQ